MDNPSIVYPLSMEESTEQLDPELTREARNRPKNSGNVMVDTSKATKAEYMGFLRREAQMYHLTSRKMVQ